MAAPSGVLLPPLQGDLVYWSEWISRRWGMDHLGLLAAAVLLLAAAWSTAAVLTRGLRWVWWTPRRLERVLRQQGIGGNPYRPLVGDTRDHARLNREARSMPMPALSHDIAPRVYPLLHQSMAKHGKICYTWFGPYPRVIVCNLDMVKDILSTKFGHFEKPKADPVAEHLVSGLVFYEGDKWAKHRRIINPAFHVEKLKCMLPAFSLCCAELIARWEKLVGPIGSYELDVWPELQKFSGDVISRTAFGSSFEEGRRIFQLQTEQAELLIQSLQNIIIPGYSWKRYGRSKRRRGYTRLPPAQIWRQGTHTPAAPAAAPEAGAWRRRSGAAGGADQQGAQEREDGEAEGLVRLRGAVQERGGLLPHEGGLPAGPRKYLLHLLRLRHLRRSQRQCSCDSTIGSSLRLRLSCRNARVRERWQGSGSACRSLYGGFVKWQMGNDGKGNDSIAVKLANESLWDDLVILIAVVSSRQKETSSTASMRDSVETSSLLHHRAKTIVPERILQMEEAIRCRDFTSFAQLTCADSNQFHVVCLDTSPPIFYMNDTSHRIINSMECWRQFEGKPQVAYTFDAGPNVVLIAPYRKVACLLLQRLLFYFPPHQDNDLARQAFCSRNFV